MKIKKLLFFTLLVSIITSNTSAMESYDKVIALVNNHPIIESEVNNKFQQIKQLKKIKRNNEKKIKKQIIENFIETAILRDTANRKSIVVSNLKVANALGRDILSFLKTHKIRKEKLKSTREEISIIIAQIVGDSLEKNHDKNNILFAKQIIKSIEKQKKLPFLQYFEEIRTQLIRQQVMSIAIGVTRPSIKTAKKWYKKNKKKLGFEYRAKHILIIPRNRSFKEEKRVNKLLDSLKRRISKGESFEKLARKYSQCPSKSKGGDLDWFMLQTMDPYFAQVVFRMRRAGQISQVFKSSFGYHIVKFVGKRPVKFKSVENLILNKLYNENIFKQYKKWIVKRKKESDIKIYDKDYKKS